MLVLAVETSTPQTSVALGGEQGVIGSVVVSWARGHSEVTVPAIDRLLEWSEIDLDQIGGVAVGLGPGLFTGLRIGISTAKGLAQVLGVPVVGIGSLDVLAFSVRYGRERICSVLDAKRGEVFWAFYRSVPGGVTRETEPTVGLPSRLAAEIEASGEETLLVGNGALLYRREFHRDAPRVDFASATNAFPLAVWLLELAVPRFYREQTSMPNEVRPLYLRKSDAEINWDRRARSA
jgi:tRNA threonylcarbamoyladenosine biosynthesis protein TsaB